MMQLRVLAADDEYSARIAIKSLDWASHDCILVGIAEDGRKLLKLLETSEADVVLLDINMPDINGLELGQIIQDHYPNVRIVYLTMYQEFDYVLAAMHQKASDYLIKDLADPRRIFKCLDKIKDEMSSKDEEIDNRERALEKEIEEKGDFIPYVGKARMVRIHVISNTEEEYPLAKTENALLSIKGVTSVRPVSHRDWILFYRKDLKNDPHSNLEKVMHMNWGDDWYASAVLEGYASAESLMQKGRAFLDECFYHQDCRFLSSGGFINTVPMNISSKIQSLMYTSLLDPGRVLNEMKGLFEICYEKKVSPSRIRHLIVVLIPRTVEDDMSVTNLMKMILDAGTAEQILRLLRGFLLKTRLVAGGTRMEVMKVQSYICTHLCENLRMQDLSEVVQLSPNYLAKIFHDETHESIKNYILRIKMETALAMIQNSDAHINEIADSLGFGSGRYFSDVFEKYFGVQPMEYRHRIMNSHASKD